MRLARPLASSASIVRDAESYCPEGSIVEPSSSSSLDEAPRNSRGSVLQRTSAVRRTSVGSSAQRVVDYLRGQIERGSLRPGDRLAPTRDLAREIGLSRQTVLEGLRWLAAMGLLRTRRGGGSFIATGPPALATGPLGLLTALHGVGPEGIAETRRMLEGCSAALAAERATGDQLAAISDEITGMFAAVEDSESFLLHDACFHRAVAAGANNVVLAALIEMVAAQYCDLGCVSIERDRNRLRQTAEKHHRIYQAIRARDVLRARSSMEEQLHVAEAREIGQVDAQRSGCAEALRGIG